MSAKTGFLVSAVQLFAMLACIGAVVAAVFTVNKIAELNKTDSELQPKELRLPNLIDVVSPTIRTRLTATAAVALVSGVVVPFGLLMVLIRPCGFEKYKCGRIVTALDFLFMFVAVSGYGVAGVLGAITAKDWSHDIIPIFPTRDIVKTIRIDIAAIAACSLLAVGLCAVLMIFILLHLCDSARKSRSQSFSGLVQSEENDSTLE